VFFSTFCYEATVFCAIRLKETEFQIYWPSLSRTVFFGTVKFPEVPVWAPQERILEGKTLSAHLHEYSGHLLRGSWFSTQTCVLYQRDRDVLRRYQTGSR